MPRIPAIRTLLTAALLLVAPAATEAQGGAELRPVDPVPFTATYQVYQVGDDGARIPAGWWRSSAGPAELDGTALVRHTWTLHFPGATVTDERLVTRDGMRPYLRLIRSPQGHHVIDFTGDSVRWTHVPLGARPSATRAMGHLPGAVALSPLLWTALALQPGDSMSVDVLNTDPPEPGTRVTAAFTAGPREIVEDGTGRTWDAVRVTQSLRVGGQPAGPQLTFWVVPEPPYEVRRAVGNQVWELTQVVEVAGGTRE